MSIDRLRALHRHATRYEIVAQYGDEMIFLGFLRNVSRRSMMKLIWDRNLGDELIDRAGITDDDEFTYSAADGLNFGDGKLRIRKSGQTEREVLWAQARIRGEV